MASNPHIPPWQSQHMHSGQMGMNRMPYNPMALPSKYQPQQMRQAPPAMYKNPMMASNPYGYSQQPPQMQGQGQQKPPPSYDPYMYPRQWTWWFMIEVFKILFYLYHCRSWSENTSEADCTE